MTLTILHLSDTHGYFPKNTKVPDYVDLVVHSGDFSPNFFVGGTNASEAYYQADWFERKQWLLKKWLNDKPMLVCQGNHDFFRIDNQSIGITDITNLEYEFKGKKFFGFPYVPAFGPWNWGLDARRMQDAVQMIPSGLDVLVAHCPPYGKLDFCPSGNIGNEHLLPYLNSLIDPPHYVLCGHVHEQGGGIAHDYGITIVNSATTNRIIEI